MPDHPRSRLPDKLSWRFDAIARAEPDRALTLEVAGPPQVLLEQLTDALNQALDRGDVRVGREHAQDQWGDCRAVVQFAVSAQLFDWFFNGRTGYRAHFRVHHECGLRFNSKIIEALRRRLDARLRDVVDGRELDGDFRDYGEAKIAKEFLITSLAPELAKVWFCAKRIGPDGGGIEVLPTGVVGPKLLLDAEDCWAAPYRDGDAAWLDVKGAFLGKAGLYQPKDPILRAQKLQDKGEA